MPRIPDVRPGRHIAESTVAIIVVEESAIEISNVKIIPAVVIVITDRRAKSPAAVAYASLRGHISEGAVMIISVELTRMAFASAHILKSGTVHQKYVHPTIIVIVKHRNAATHRFHDVTFLETPAGQMKIEARSASH